MINENPNYASEARVAYSKQITQDLMRLRPTNEQFAQQYEKAMFYYDHPEVYDAVLHGAPGTGEKVEDETTRGKTNS